MNTLNKEILEGNKLIAEFMTGKDKESQVFFDLNCAANDLKYYSSWDWLMPVINKGIEYGLHFQLANGEVNCWADGMYKYYMPYLTDEQIIKNVWLALIEFIKYYNQNKN